MHHVKYFTLHPFLYKYSRIVDKEGRHQEANNDHFWKQSLYFRSVYNTYPVHLFLEVTFINIK